jgi:outer membrane protein TolC
MRFQCRTESAAPERAAEGDWPMFQRATRVSLIAFGFAGLVTATVCAAGQSPLPPVPTGQTLPVPPPPVGADSRVGNSFATKVGVQKDKDEKDKYDDPTPDLAALVESGPELSLGECIAIAIERHPSILAARASLSATSAGSKALQNFGTPATLLSPDLDIRKQQAQRGLTASTAEYQRACNEVVQDVTRMYYTAVYAKQQDAVAAALIPQLRSYIRIARDLLANEPNPKNLEGLTPGKVEVMQIGLREALSQQLLARIGRQQAMAALRQAMAVDERTFPFRVKDAELPLMGQTKEITKELVVDLALSRRPELALAAAGLDAFRLEVYAQGKIPFKRVVPTFASGSDLHSKDIPSAMRGKEYRPGGVAPELPPQLVGSKFDRVCRAMAYSQRAEAVFESVRGLVSLEAENGYYEFEAASIKLRLAKESLDLGLSLRKRTQENAPNTKAKDALVQAEVIAAKAQSDYVKAVWEYLLTLSALERITAGGIRPAFPGR